MIEAALNIAAAALVEYSATGISQQRDGNRSPGYAPQGVYACKGQEQWLAISVSRDDQWGGLRRALDYPEWANHPILASHAGRHASQDELDAQLAACCIDRDARQTAERLRAHGVPAAVMLDPRLGSTHAQFAERGYFELVDHAVVGVHPVPTLLFRFASVDRWIRSPAPTLGEHTRQVLTELAAVSSDELERLEQGGVIGTSLDA